MSLTGTITLFSVGDADAILIHLTKPGKDLVMVVDCGRAMAYEKKMKAPLKKLLDDLGKAAPDIVVVTHYDDDHIDGVKALVEDYGDAIGELWALEPPEGYEDRHAVMESLRPGVMPIPDFEGFLAKSDPRLDQNVLLEGAVVLNEVIGDVRELAETFKHKGLRHVRDGDTVKGWEEIKVLGPTPKYYAALFKDKSFTALAVDEALAELAHKSLLEQKTMLKNAGITGDPCAQVKADGIPSLSIVNRASVIFAIDAKEGRYLFTGDAGIESFRSIPDYKKELAELYWLKIPHHGSSNNTTRETIALMRPKYADCSGGNRYQDDEVLDCMAKEPRAERAPRSTKSGKDLVFSIGSTTHGR